MDQKQYEYNAGLVSIVSLVYNGEAHLAKMLDYVLAQTYPDVEMILVDDGSADGTVRAVQNYSEKLRNPCFVKTVSIILVIGMLLYILRRIAAKRKGVCYEKNIGNYSYV